MAAGRITQSPSTCSLLARNRQRESPQPVEWNSAASRLLSPPPIAAAVGTESSFSGASSRSAWGDTSSRLDTGSISSPPRKLSAANAQPTPPPDMQGTFQLGASMPSGATPETTARSSGSPPECSNPVVHKCLLGRQQEMEKSYSCCIPGFLAGERIGNEGPCCGLSSSLHTVVHVCECMQPYELDRALAVENLRLERVRDAHMVVLGIAQQYGVERVLEDEDLLLRVTSSILQEASAIHKKKDTEHEKESHRQQQQNLQHPHHHLHHSGDDELFTPPYSKELHAAPSMSLGLESLEEKLSDGVQQQFGFRSLGTLTACDITAADDSWTLAVQEANELRIFFRRHCSSTMISFRVEGTVDANLLNIISVLHEMDLYKEWIPYYSFPVKLGLRDVKKIYQLGRVDQVDLLQLDFPWPMNNRDCCVAIWAADDLDYSNRFFIRITSLDAGSKNPRIPLVPMPANKTLRLYFEGAIVLVPLAADKSFIELVWTLDPKAHLSEYIVNFFTRVFAKASFHAFCKVCIEASSGEHAKRRAAFPLLYGFVAQRLAEVGNLLGQGYRKEASSTVPHDQPFTAEPMDDENKPPSTTRSKEGKDGDGEEAHEQEYKDRDTDHPHSKKCKSGKIFPFRKRRSACGSNTSPEHH
ncbi:uncharacterized protein LOC34617391 [Cyclospora cayetanensis]|uniref:Uncharacterized protein LOC34617391 n=1 Tax=Cyclospora cayetanensis TaxID=88456 RepID=A0A6P6RTG9_9EIME|nr:uncharacterized protein LOC34617391 [Cyclospora cayetanensis]